MWASSLKMLDDNIAKLNMTCKDPPHQWVGIGMDLNKLLGQFHPNTCFMSRVCVPSIHLWPQLDFVCYSEHFFSRANLLIAGSMWAQPYKFDVIPWWWWFCIHCVVKPFLYVTLLYKLELGWSIFSMSKTKLGWRSEPIVPSFFLDQLLDIVVNVQLC
mgnify:FL=1